MQKNILKNPALFHDENINNQRIEGDNLYMINVMYEKFTVNILRGKRLKFFHLKSGTTQGCPFSLLLNKVVLEALSQRG